MNIFLGFDFYGAGNIGDDLMLSGFIEGVVKKVGFPICIHCCIEKESIRSQQLRFPEIRWHRNIPSIRHRLLEQCSLWLGVGGTPFQGSSGDWLLKSISSDLGRLPGSTPRAMLAIGCEKEVSRYLDMAKRVAAGVDLIITRDQASADILVGCLGCDKSQIAVGADLAHISLSRLFPESDSKHGNGIGIIAYHENGSDELLDAIKTFSEQAAHSSPVTFFANDVRGRGFERSFYVSMYGSWSFLRACLNADIPRFYAPPYSKGSLNDLVSHFKRPRLIISSRYHALLCSAWAGSRLVALDRGSKIQNLANELDIPIVSFPWSAEKLWQATSEAPVIQTARLEAMRLKAEKACNSILAMIQGIEDNQSCLR